MKTLRTLTLFVIFLAMIGCSKYTVPTQSMISQLKENQRLERNVYFQKFSLIDYPSNNLEKIKCVDNTGDQVWLYPDKNTQIVIIKKSNGEKIKSYFDTVIFQNDTIYGLRSRLAGGLRIVPVNDIAEIVVTAEMPRIEKVDN